MISPPSKNTDPAIECLSLFPKIPTNPDACWKEETCPEFFRPCLHHSTPRCDTGKCAEISQKRSPDLEAGLLQMVEFATLFWIRFQSKQGGSALRLLRCILPSRSGSTNPTCFFFLLFFFFVFIFFFFSFFSLFFFWCFSFCVLSLGGVLIDNVD